MRIMYEDIYGVTDHQFQSTRLLASLEPRNPEFIISQTTSMCDIYKTHLACRHSKEWVVICVPGQDGLVKDPKTCPRFRQTQFTKAEICHACQEAKKETLGNITVVTRIALGHLCCAVM